MTKFRYLLFLTTALLLLAACSKNHEEGPGPEIPDPERPEIAPQTLMFYFSGRGNLVYSFDQNIANALKAVNKNILGYSRVLIFRQTGINTATISELIHNPGSTGKARQTVLKNYDETLVSTDGPTMTRILNDMIALAPAEQYGLVLSSHATGWIPSIFISTAIQGIRPVDDYWKKSDGEPQTRGFGNDNSQTMEMPTLAESLDATGKRYEYLIFDACFMSSIEAIYDLRNVTKHVVASPCEVMLYGHPYDESLPYLFTNGGKEYDLAGFCERFHNFYSTTAVTVQSGCIALIDCSELDALANVMRRIHAVGLKNYDPERIQIYEGLSPHLFFDLGDFVEVSCTDAGLLAEFKSQFDKTLPPASRLHTPTFYTDFGRVNIPVTSYSGISVSEPSTKYTQENRQTNWYKDTHQ